jgi:hypothetical protein
VTSCTIGSQGGGNSLIRTRKKGGKGFTPPAHSQFRQCTPLLTSQTSAAHHSREYLSSHLWTALSARAEIIASPTTATATTARTATRALMLPTHLAHSCRLGIFTLTDDARLAAAAVAGARAVSAEKERDQSSGNQSSWLADQREV